MEKTDKQKKVLWRILKTGLKIAATAVALYWVSTKVKFSDLTTALLGSDFLYLIFAFIAYMCSQWIAASRLYGYFKAIGMPITERYNFRLFLLGLFYNMFLPGGIGGDGYKLFFLRKKFGLPGKKVFSAIFFDRLSGLWALALITAALVIFIPRLEIPNWAPILVVLLGTAVYYVIIRKYFKDFISVFFSGHLKAIGSWSFQIMTVILLLYALDFEGKFSPYLFTFLLSSLVAIVPITPGGLGLKEMVNVYGASYFQMDTHLAVLISLLFYVIAAVFALSGAYFIFNPGALGADRIPAADELEQELKEEKLPVADAPPDQDAADAESRR